VPDLVDKSKEFIADLKQVAPDRPFFMYFCPGACHAPHHVPQEWIAKLQGQVRRRLGRLPRKGPGQPDQAGHLPARHQALAARPGGALLGQAQQGAEGSLRHQMEVYAAYLSYVDHYIGELVAFLDEMGQLDNTLIITVSDNGASPEGGPNGSFNENLFFNNAPQPLSLSLKHLKQWGGPSTYPHYSWGWAFATNTPFRRWKREVARGGHLRPVHRPLAQGLQGQGRHSPPVHPRHRPGAHRARRLEVEDADVDQRRGPDATGGG